MKNEHLLIVIFVCLSLTLCQHRGMETQSHIETYADKQQLALDSFKQELAITKLEFALQSTLIENELSALMKKRRKRQPVIREARWEHQWPLPPQDSVIIDFQ